MTEPNAKPELSAVLGELYARVPRGMRLGLESTHAACARFDHPERKLAIVHVAGTNGKGSTSAMIESVARAAGLETGLFTSPHLARFAERIRIGNIPIDDARLSSILGDVLRREPELSFFEVATLAAFVAFHEAKVDLAVLEVGIGGRLDATNVVPSPRACAVTRIALDHADRLGATLPEIAREKASIAKPGAPIFLGPMPDAILSVMEGVAAERGATAIRVATLPDAVGFRDRAVLALAGEHQKDNAMVAYAVARHLGFDEATCKRGIEIARWPGRLERVDLPDGAVLFDAAHNPDGAEALAAYLAKSKPPEAVALVFGALADKDWPGMLDRIAPSAGVRAYAPASGRAATDPAAFAARHSGAAFSSAMGAYRYARAAVGSTGWVVVCGSISLVGELRCALLGEPRDPPVAL